MQNDLKKPDLNQQKQSTGAQAVLIIFVNYFLEPRASIKTCFFLSPTEFTSKFVSEVFTNIYLSYILILNPFQFPHGVPRLWKIPFHQKNEKERLKQHSVLELAINKRVKVKK